MDEKWRLSQYDRNILSNAHESIDEAQIASIENYLTTVYFPSDHKYQNINEARVKYFFKSPNPDLRSTIISRASLIEYNK